MWSAWVSGWGNVRCGLVKCAFFLLFLDLQIWAVELDSPIMGITEPAPTGEKGPRNMQ